MDGLAFGAILAIVLRSKIADRAFIKKLAIASFGVFAIATIAGLSHGIGSKSPDFIGKALRPTAVNFCAFGVVASTLLVGSSQFARFVKPKWVQFLGFVSYGFYLLHVLTLHLYDTIVGLPVDSFFRASVRAGIVFFVTVALAWLSRMTVEEWFLNKKDLLDHPQR